MDGSAAAEAPPAPAATAAPEPEAPQSKKPRRKRWSWRIGSLLFLTLGVVIYNLTKETKPPHHQP